MWSVIYWGDERPWLWSQAKPWHVVYSGGKGEHCMLSVCSRITAGLLHCFLSAAGGHCWLWDQQRGFLSSRASKTGFKNELRSAPVGLNPLLWKKKKSLPKLDASCVYHWSDSFNPQCFFAASSLHLCSLLLCNISLWIFLDCMWIFHIGSVAFWTRHHWWEELSFFCSAFVKGL